eukprot:2694264-Rhodomonas_salina.2
MSAQLIARCRNSNHVWREAVSFRSQRRLRAHHGWGALSLADASTTWKQETKLQRTVTDVQRPAEVMKVSEPGSEG